MSDLLRETFVRCVSVVNSNSFQPWCQEFEFLTNLVLRVLALIKTGELHWIEQLLDLLF